MSIRRFMALMPISLLMYVKSLLLFLKRILILNCRKMGLLYISALFLTLALWMNL